MKKLISLLTLVSFISFTVPVRSQEKTPNRLPELMQEIVPVPAKTDPDIGAAISPLKKLQDAPFAGVLLSPLAIATLIADLNARAEETKLEVDRETAKLTAEFDYQKSIIVNECQKDKEVFAAQLDHKQNEIKILNDALTSQQTNQPDPLLWAFIGLSVGVVSAAATASVITAVSK